MLMQTPISSIYINFHFITTCFLVPFHTRKHLTKALSSHSQIPTLFPAGKGTALSSAQWHPKPAGPEQAMRKKKKKNKKENIKKKKIVQTLQQKGLLLSPPAPGAHILALCPIAPTLPLSHHSSGCSVDEWGWMSFARLSGLTPPGEQDLLLPITHH